MIVITSLANTPVLPPDVIEEFGRSGNIDFVSNEQLDDVLEETDSHPGPRSRGGVLSMWWRCLEALKISFLVLASDRPPGDHSGRGAYRIMPPRKCRLRLRTRAGRQLR